MNLRISREHDGIITISHPTEDRHIDINATPEILALSPDDFERRVLEPARTALLTKAGA